MNRLISKFRGLNQGLNFGYVSYRHPTEKYIPQLSDKELMDKELMNLLLSKRIPKHTIVSQFGLFHGKQPKSGNQTCFSEKKYSIDRSRRSWFPNILERDVSVRVSTKTMRMIRLYGSFDNYILLSEARDLDSNFGEYLRQLMLRKLNNKDFLLPLLQKEQIHKITRLQRRRVSSPPYVWHPPEIRHKDLTFMMHKSEQLMTPKELRKLRKVQEIEEQFENIDLDHPLIKEMIAEDADFEALFEKEGGQYLEELKRKEKDGRVKKMLEHIESLEDEQQEVVRVKRK